MNCVVGFHEEIRQQQVFLKTQLRNFEQIVEQALEKERKRSEVRLCKPGG